jgi:hypothetical protein
MLLIGHIDYFIHHMNSDMFILRPPDRLPLQKGSIYSTLLNRLQTKYSALMRQYADDIVVRASQLTPVRTGRLRAGYQVAISGRYPMMMARIMNPVPYFNYIEYGRRVKGVKEVYRGRGYRGIGKEKTDGVRMLGRSIDENAQRLDELHQNFEHEFSEVIQ